MERANSKRGHRPQGGGTQPYSLEQAQAAFWSKVEKGGECWVWMGAKSAAKYGTFRTHHTSETLAHRVAYVWLIGDIPSGVLLHHLCGNPACVNPDHLLPVTYKEHGSVHASGRDTCSNGHQRTPENTYCKPNGRRECLECRRASYRNWKAAHIDLVRAWDRARSHEKYLRRKARLVEAAR